MAEKTGRFVSVYQLYDENTTKKGPTPNSNWVIPGKLIAGAYPGSADSETKHRDVITAIIDSGI